MPVRYGGCQPLRKLDEHLVGVGEDDAGSLFAIERLRGARYRALDVAFQLGGEHAAIVIEVRIARDALEQVVGEHPMPLLVERADDLASRAAGEDRQSRGHARSLLDQQRPSVIEQRDTLAGQAAEARV